MSALKHERHTPGEAGTTEIRPARRFILAGLKAAFTARRSGARHPPRMPPYYQRVGPGEGSVAALSTARSISSTVISGVMLTRTTPVELPTSDTAVADAASG